MFVWFFISLFSDLGKFDPRLVFHVSTGIVVILDIIFFALINLIVRERIIYVYLDK